ncbi:hypothetical protein ANN_15514 [Periplaneta americana]|uniref:Uncharacterized protein n=1 Tax=Periplaneta americana TaxID=6978 RepID=A0ABQ8SGK3_PERAM|nr:hypothetical protein ANN_15514 [Periplaneta americana]
MFDVKLNLAGELTKSPAFDDDLCYRLDPSPLARNTLWTVLIGTTLLRLGNMVNQASVQKFISLPKKSNISNVDWIGDSEMVSGEIKPRIRRRLPDIRLAEAQLRIGRQEP